MVIIGDIHGEFDLCSQIAYANPDEKCIQIGDFGFGFRLFPEFPSNLYFIRGNHDAPEACQQHPKYLGDFGFDGEIFWVGGADSIDRHLRIEGKTWWRDEQLSYTEFLRCIDLFAEKKPRIVISHDGPQSIINQMFGIKDASATRAALQAMLDTHRPDLWIFGHHPVPKQFGGFRCLGINEEFYC